MQVPAVVAAGDRGAAKAIRGESKAFLAVGERPLVADSVLVLQRVPEVSEVIGHLDVLVEEGSVVMEEKNGVEHARLATAAPAG